MSITESSATLRDPSFLGVQGSASPDDGVIIVSDDPALAEVLEAVCTFLDLRAQCVTSGMNLKKLLQQRQPVAVISDIEGEERDGFDTMKVVADCNRDLPIFMLTDGDPVLMGAVDAVQEICRLTTLTCSTGAPLAGELVSFLSNAGRRAGCMRLVQVRH
jgi:hypothetical protein